MFWHHPSDWINLGQTDRQSHVAIGVLMSPPQVAEAISSGPSIFDNPKGWGHDLRWSSFVTSWWGDSLQRWSEFTFGPSMFRESGGSWPSQKITGDVRSSEKPNPTRRHSPCFPWHIWRESVAAGDLGFSGDSCVVKFSSSFAFEKLSWKGK